MANEKTWKKLDLLPPGTASQFQDTLDAYTGRRTVPNILLNGKSIGGGDEVEALHDAGKLVPLVQATGAMVKQKVILGVHNPKYFSIRNHPVVVFTKSYDPYSKEVLAVLGIVGASPITGRKTTPNVFVGGKTIGGSDDTKQLHATGELTLLLQRAGAL
ncbi:hypothetical protein DYB34_007635 [Aphanomyces astaci]|uniref:Glutaredoxin domain-containing protein n=1 Tax=Aphanomyces astaci TaxID=112090 RepID=A0A418BNG8_APHAT|nr:hypothetical protein DYB34_007635 [Aphanomyces astaci]